MSRQPENVWPLPKFSFVVECDSEVMHFQEVSGLDIESKEIEYRHGDSPVFSTVEMPPAIKSGNVTLKRGVITKNAKFWDWFSEIKINTIKRKSVTVMLLDEAGEPTMTWTLVNAFPIKVAGVDLKGDGNEVMVETVDLAHEGLTIANG